MSYTRLSDGEKIEILRRKRQGESQASIAAALGRSGHAIHLFLRQHAEIPGLPALTSYGERTLGPSVVKWATEHAGQVRDVRLAMLEHGWQRPETASVIVLALAQVVRAELLQQTGGISPTMRTALYRAMGVYGATKELYKPLAVHTADARHGGLFPRDFWSDAEPSDETAPAWWSAEYSLQYTLEPVARPGDAFHDIGHVFGVVLETRGAAAPIRGAWEQRFGYRIPVWSTGGQAPIPRLLHIEREMHEWAERSGDAEPHVIGITDHDASGLIIGRCMEEQLEGIHVVRIGMSPDLAERYGAPDAAEIPGDEDEEDKKTHRKTEVWRDAVEEYGDVEYQAEALDYATWTDEIAGAMSEILEADGISLDDVGVDDDPDFDRVDAFLAALSDRLDQHDGDLDALADDLGLDIEP